MLNNYYVYAYLRKKDNSPYYIGKGKRYRAYSPIHNVSVPKNRANIVFWHENLTEKEAHDAEIFYISMFKRKSDGGILRNQTLGGQGFSGMRVSAATKRKISIKNKGKKRTAAARLKMSKAQLGRKNKPASIERKRKISEALKGRPSHWKGKRRTKENCARLSVAVKEVWKKRKENIVDKSNISKI
mgnify:CR=1 FL=1